jgi:hypothetical protein
MKQMVAAPVNTRQMLLAFAMYDPAEGINSFLNRVDFQGVTRRQIYFSVLGRAPENAKQVLDGPNYRPRGHMANALQSDEFQTRVREIVLTAFPEKRRIIFVHIPKCAGTDMRVALCRRYPYLHNDISLARATDKPRLFNALREFALGVGLADGIMVTGHAPLRWYVERRLPRFEDDLFSTVRHPRDIIYSHICYILTRLITSEGPPRHDIVEWLSKIGMTEIAPNPSPAYLLDLGSKLLRCRPITSPNIMCDLLGRGTAESAIEAIVTSNIEITDISRYSQWRKAKLGFDPPNKINPSQALFTPETASAADRAFIDDMISEDMKLYGKIQTTLAASDNLSLRGAMLA